MAATITEIANGNSIVSNTTVVTDALVTASVDDWLVVVAASSNDGSGGAASQTGVVDSDGVNVYTQRALINYDPGAAGAGATLGIYTCPVTSALSNDTITVNHSDNTDQKAVHVYQVDPGAGETVSFIAADTTGSTGNATTHSAATVSVTSGDIIFGAAAIETDDAVTGDTDTDSGSWSFRSIELADGGADASCMSVVSQVKTVTATANQAWACTTSTGRDSARTYLVLRSATAGINISPTSGNLALSTVAPEVTWTDHRTISPSSGNLALSSVAPTVVQNAIREPASGNLVLSTVAPEVTQNAIKEPTTGNLALSTFAPEVTWTDNRSISPTSGNLALSTVAPTVVVGVAITPNTADLTLSSVAPTVTQTTNADISPSTGNLALSTFVPTVAVTTGAEIAPSTGSLILSTVAPTVALTANINVSPQTAQLVLEAFAPTVEISSPPAASGARLLLLLGVGT